LPIQFLWVFIHHLTHWAQGHIVLPIAVSQNKKHVSRFLAKLLG